MTSIENHPILYKRTSSGSIQEWGLQVDTTAAAIRSKSGKQGGKAVYSGWDYIKGKNHGKSNATTDIEQCQVVVCQKYDKQLKGKYHETIETIDNKRFFEPTLAKKFMERRGSVHYPVTVQRKFNGARYIRQAHGAFSRSGNQFHNTQHIIEATEDVVQSNPGIVLDGEIYSDEHRKNLNRLISVVSVKRKEEDLTPEIIAESKRIARYHVYDGFGFEGITQETPYLERQAALNEIIRPIDYLEEVQSDTAASEEEVFSLFKSYVDDEYEGAIIRFNSRYDNKRSPNLLKLKEWEDGEFKILRFEDAKGHWANCLKRIICEVRLSDGNVGEFVANPRGFNREELRELYKLEVDYVSKYISVEYQFLSEYGIPQIPYTELVVRDYE